MIQDEYAMLQELLSKEMCTAQHQEGGEMGTKDTERMQQLTPFFIRICRRNYSDIHTSYLINPIVKLRSN